MQTYRGWHTTAIIISIIAVVFITYTTLLINNFKTPETTAAFLKQSNSYYYIAEIVKANIRNRYPTQLRSNVVRLTIADSLLNIIVSPNTVEHLALPALRLRQKAAHLPLSFVEHNLVLNTSQYTQQASTTLASLDLPPAILDAGNNLIAAIPPQISIVDVQKRPNSILARITRMRIFFDHLQTLLTIAWIVLVIAIIALIALNLKFLRRLTSGFFWIFVIPGGIMLVFSFLIPALVSALSSNPDPVAGVLKDELVDSMIWQYFSQTIPASIIYLVLAFGFFLLLRFLPFASMQNWTNIHMLRESIPAASITSSKQPTKHSSKKRKKR